MTRVVFTSNLARHVPCAPVNVGGESVREVLDAALRERPGLREYVVDDQGALRRHMVIFVDGRQIRDRAGLSDRVDADTEVYVMQALSGG